MDIKTIPGAVAVLIENGVCHRSGDTYYDTSGEYQPPRVVPPNGLALTHADFAAYVEKVKREAWDAGIAQCCAWEFSGVPVSKEDGDECFKQWLKAQEGK